MDKIIINKDEFRDKDILYSKNGYVHFDSRISLNDCWDYVTNPDKIKIHKFYPFIKYEQIFNKYVVNENDKLKKVKKINKNRVIKIVKKAKGTKKLKKAKKVKKTKRREICYASHIDSCIYTYYARLLNKEYNNILEKNKIDYKIEDETFSSVIAYRTNLSGKSNINFAHEAITFIRELHDCMVIVGDFKSFFDTLNHNYLKQQIKAVLGVKHLSSDWYAVFKSITRYSYVDLGQLIYRTCEKEGRCYKKQYVDIKNGKNKKDGKDINPFLCRFKCCNAKFFNNSYGNIQRYASTTVKDNNSEGYNKGNCLNRYCQKAFNQKVKLDIRFARENKLIKVPYRKNSDGEYEHMGIPQGSAISAVFANVYMLEFDNAITNYVKELKGKYMRYSDDFIIILPKDNKFDEHLKYLQNMVSNVKIILEPKKTQIFDVCLDNNIPIKSCSSMYLKGISDGKNAIDYLGFTFDGKNATIKMKTIFKYYYRMYSKIKYIKINRKKYGVDTVGTANLYKRYSSKIFHWEDKNDKEDDNGNFLTYVKRVQRVFVDDKDINAPVRHHLDKITSRINKKDK